MPQPVRPGYARPSVDLRHPYRARHLWLPLAIYAAIRLLDAVILSWASRFQVSTSPLRSLHPLEYFVFREQPARPGVLGLVTNWDGEWYHLLATSGYGDPGPYTGAEGAYVMERSWHFPPGYPMLVGAVMRLFGTGFPTTAAVVSLLAGAVAMLLIHRLTLRHVGELGANGAVALTSCWVSAPVMHIAHSEALALALLAAVLLALDRRRPWLAAALTVPLALTRIITPPLAVVTVVVYWHLWRTQRPRPGRRELWGAGVLTVVSVLGVFAWSALVAASGHGLGDDPASAHARLYSGGWIGEFASVAPWAGLVPLVVFGSLAWAAWSERSYWGMTLSTWAAAYTLFLLLGTAVNMGSIRYSLMAFPLALLLVGRPEQSSRRRVTRIAVGCLVLVCLQVVWVRHALVLHDPGGQPWGL